MIGGGNWIKQDKKLNGSYIVFKSNRKSKRNVRTGSGSGAGGGGGEGLPNFTDAVAGMALVGQVKVGEI